VDLQADLMLGEFVRVSEGSLTIVGAGWVVREPEPTGPAGIGIVVTVPRDQPGPHHLRLELLDAQGKTVEVAPGDPLVAEQEFTVSGLEDPTLTVPLTSCFAINVAPFPLPEASEFRWQLHLNGETREDWSLRFRTSPPLG
jgi:hypothetical protein